MNLDNQKRSVVTSQLNLLLAFAGLVLLLLLMRAFYLQMFRGEHYLALSRDNFIQTIPTAHSRGRIFDRFGTLLVTNRPSHDIFLTRAFLPDSERSIAKLGRVLGMSKRRQSELDAALLESLEGQEVRKLSFAHENPFGCEALDQFLREDELAGVTLRNRAVMASGCVVTIDNQVFPSRAAVRQRLQDALDYDPRKFQAAWDRAWRRSRRGQYQPFRIVSDVDEGAANQVRLEISRGLLPGIQMNDSMRRRYPFGDRASHVLGFMNEVSSRDLRQNAYKHYHLGDRVGRRGVERVFENYLRGEDGKRFYIVDAKGREHGAFHHHLEELGLEPIESRGGHDIRLTIDEELQEWTEGAFLGAAGSVVVIDVNNGEVLALASFPHYDLNELAGRGSGSAWLKLSRDALKPLRNKAVQEHYAPGSTFKAFTGVAGLVHGQIRSSSVKTCYGNFFIGRQRWRCYNRGGHGPLSLPTALKVSCDSYFYNLGVNLGLDRLASTAQHFGFGRKSGIALDGEVPGLIPTREYYASKGGGYRRGYVVNASIGQGDVIATPLQLANAYAALVNGGDLFRPRIVHEVRDATGLVTQSFIPEVIDHLDIKESDLEEIRRSLSYVTRAGGTAYSLRDVEKYGDLARWVRKSGVVIGGKTGTAQVVSLSKNIDHLDPEAVEYHKRDHAWFVGFAPIQEPEIVVVAMTEHGGFGGSASAPVVANVIRKWHELKVERGGAE